MLRTVLGWRDSGLVAAGAGVTEAVSDAVEPEHGHECSLLVARTRRLSAAVRRTTSSTSSLGWAGLCWVLAACQWPQTLRERRQLAARTMAAGRTSVSTATVYAADPELHAAVTGMPVALQVVGKLRDA